jgi:hypothetical protein
MSAESPTGELLDDVVAFVRRYVVLSNEQATAVALWTVHTHAVDALGITPYLAITRRRSRAERRSCSRSSRNS